MTTIRTRNESKPRTVQCVECGNDFETTHSQGKYCSPVCRQIGDRKSWNKYNRANRKYRREYQRRHHEDIKVERAVQIKRYQKSPRGKEIRRKIDINSRKNHPEKYKARQEVLMAKRKGIITPQPCFVCGEPITEAHHIDYSKPLDVIWLCKLHHEEVHQNKIGICIEDGMIAHDNYKNPQ
jgi:endogenous inhibitor of DNA gyrase (YacG/DUF329 family)